MTLPSPVQVFGADEQDAVAVDVLRYVRLAQLVLTSERAPVEAEASVIFVDERAIADLNERFLDSPGPTDVLAFPIDDPIDAGRWPDSGSTGPDREPPELAELPMLLGDVVVCPAVAARQAPTHAGSYEDELALLVVHGVLHVLGMDHAEPAQAERMRRREQELLAKFAESERDAQEGLAP